MPARPVAQLALPEFTTTARTRPPVASNAARPTSTGAATTRLVVNKAAADVPSPASAKARSGRPLTLIPALTAEKEKPLGTLIFSGDRRSEVMPESSTNSLAAARLRRLAEYRGSSLFHRNDKAGDTDNNLCVSYRANPDDSLL